MTNAQRDPEYVSEVLVDALALGDKSTAAKWGLDRRTIQRYRVMARTDPKLQALIEEKNAATAHDLATLRISFLRDALDAARGKLATATLYEVAGAIKIVGELHATAMMIEDGGDDEQQSDPASEAATEGQGGRRSDAGGKAPAAEPRH